MADRRPQAHTSNCCGMIPVLADRRQLEGRHVAMLQGIIDPLLYCGFKPRTYSIRMLVPRVSMASGYQDLCEYEPPSVLRMGSTTVCVQQMGCLYRASYDVMVSGICGR